MRIVFMGTPPFAATILEQLTEHHEVEAVYTRPDAIRGRGKHAVSSPVKEVALQNGLEVRTPNTLRDAEVQRELAALDPDVICVAAYGAILPVEVLDIPRYGCLNVHASLLPRWRGAAPIERAILAGDDEVGVSIMRMEEGLDTGDYCVSRAMPAGTMNLEALTDELAILGAAALLTALVQLEEESVFWVKQDESQATYAAKIKKHELDLTPSESAQHLSRKVRASSAAHPSRAALAGRSVTVLAAQTSDYAFDTPLQPGEVRYTAKHLLLGCAEGALEVLRVKPDGKKAMDAQAFAAGVQGIKHGGLGWEAPRV